MDWKQLNPNHLQAGAAGNCLLDPRTEVTALGKGPPLKGEDPTWRAENKLVVGKCIPCRLRCHRPGRVTRTLSKSRRAGKESQDTTTRQFYHGAGGGFLPQLGICGGYNGEEFWELAAHQYVVGRSTGATNTEDIAGN